MFIKASIISLVVTITATVAQEVQWYNAKSCAGGSSVDDRDVGCNVCVDPVGDWQAVGVSGIGANQRVTAHNQNGCTSASQVAQQFGPVCIVAGATALRSFWVSC